MLIQEQHKSGRPESVSCCLPVWFPILLRSVTSTLHAGAGESRNPAGEMIGSYDQHQSATEREDQQRHKRTLPVLSPLLPTTERGACSNARQAVTVGVGNLPVLQNSATMSHRLTLRRAGRVVCTSLLL